jgi:hypothetical protein
MTGKQSPFWNQDAIMAAGLAFAGMSVLQSKLFASMSWAEWPWLRSLTESHLFQWWPLLLIALGVVLWIARAWERRAQKSYRTAALMGGQRGTKVVAAHPQIVHSEPRHRRESDLTMRFDQLQLLRAMPYSVVRLTRPFLLCPSFLNYLLRTAQRQRLRRHIFRDARSGAHVGSFAQPYRSNQS